MKHLRASVCLFCLMTSVVCISPRRMCAQAPSASAPASPSVRSPNIIFILADDQGWNGTSVQMHPELESSRSDFYRTPHLERLAQQGVRFSQAYAPGPMCSPTRASLQTGKSPAKLGMTNVGSGSRGASPSQRLIPGAHTGTLARSEFTIGEALQTAGYSTAWFGKWHLGPDGPGHHGYDESDGPTGNADGITDDPKNPKDIFGITERGLAFMETNARAGKPFYLQLWHYAVHGPVQAQPETEAAYERRPPGQTHNSPSFAGMTEDFDRGIGMILDKIDELEIGESTYVVYMSDHGASRGVSSNDPLNRGKGTLWEGGIRVPLIIRGPGVSANEFCNVPVVGWDMFPTFCGIANIPVPEEIEGVSLLPLLGTRQATEDQFSRSLAFHFPHYGAGPPQSTILHDGFKLVKFYESEQLHLFDLSRDIGEQTDLAEKDPSKTKALHQRLNDYLASIDAKLPRINPEFDPEAVATTGRRGGRADRRAAQVAARKLEVANLTEALEDDDLEKVGELITQMQTSLTSQPARGRPGGGRQGGGRGNPSRGNSTGPSPRQQREADLKQLQEAYSKADLELLKQVVSQITARLEPESR